MDVLRGILAIISFLFTLFWIVGTIAIGRDWKPKLFFGALAVFDFLSGIVLISWGSC